MRRISFDTELMESIGETLGQECQAEDVSVLLGPAVNIKRSPCAEGILNISQRDPYRQGEMAAAHIRGVQKWDEGDFYETFCV